jgi:hypothetical protein
VATIKALYGTSNQAITLTLTSLASAAARQSTVVSNTTDLFLDALVAIKTKTGTPLSSDKAIYVYAYGSSDGGSTYPDAVTGSDAAYTMISPTNLKLIGIINAPTASTAYEAGPWSVAAAFGGVLPEKWGVVVQNATGATLSVTGGDHGVWYQGVSGQTV